MNRNHARSKFLPLLLALMTQVSGVAAEKLPSISDLKQRAGQGDVKAALSLGMRYRDGRGVERDYEKALQWYRKSADQGDAQGLDNVGFMYLRGWGVPKNPEIAVAFFKAGAKGGNPQAGYNLGESYFSGLGVPQDYDLAMEAWEAAAEQGHAQAKWRLAMMAATGEGMARDIATAEEWCRELAGKNHAKGMLLLGELCYRDGRDEEAQQWWKKSSERGNSQAKTLLELAEWRSTEPVAGRRAYVEVDHIYQGWNNCGATSMSMFLRQAGGDLSPYKVKRLCPQSPIGTGTDWAHLVAVAPKAGQGWELVTFANDDSGFAEGVLEIQKHLDRQQPVVIDFTVERQENGETVYYGHTLLLVGYNADSDQFVLKNPNQPSPGIELMGSEELKANWYSRGYSRSAKGKAARPLIVHLGKD